MNARFAHRPRGQVLLITAFSMLVLIAITAIVVDLGMSWMLRRQEQNAADPAAIAAARYIQDGDTPATRTAMDQAACFYAKENGFFQNDDGACTAAFGGDQLQVLWPPVGPLAGEFAGRPEMVQVIISANHDSFFGQFLGQPEATVTTGAVAARETESANSNSLVALDPDSCAAGWFTGNGVIHIAPVTNPDTGQPYSGGYVHVNSSCNNGSYNDACSNGNGGLKRSGNASGQLIAPHIYVHGTCETAGGTITSPVTEGAPQIGDPLAGLIGPRQEDYPAGYCPKKQGPSIIYVLMTPTMAGCQINALNGATVTLTPGVYWGGIAVTSNNVTVKMLPGIYIFAGGGFKATQGSITSLGADPTSDPARVLIYSTDNTTDPSCTAAQARCVQDAISLSGQTSLMIWGLDSGPYRGLLIWQDGRGSNPAAPISLTGDGAMDIAGTIYAPNAHVDIGGNGTGSGVLAVQIISWTWKVNGNGNLYMPYDPALLYTILQRGLVH